MNEGGHEVADIEGRSFSHTLVRLKLRHVGFIVVVAHRAPPASRRSARGSTSRVIRWPHVEQAATCCRSPYPSRRLSAETVHAPHACRQGNLALGDVGNLARATDAEVCRALFVPAGAATRAGAGVHVVDARAVMSVLR